MQYDTLAVAVVIYNTSCSESSTCQGLRAISNSGFHVLIYDNSTSDYGVQHECQANGWVYLGGSGNVGLSKAYNQCIEYMLSYLKSVKFLCLMDDDTCISSEYFNSLLNAIQKSKADIYLPIIYSGNHLLSPCRLLKGYRCKTFHTVEDAISYNGPDLTGINSGMCIHMSIFDEYRYDENIFLDGVDHHFIHDMHTGKKVILIFPYICNHAFSGYERPSLESAQKRFQILSKDYSYILRGHPFYKLFLLGKRAVKLCIQYHTLAFLSYL